MIFLELVLSGVAWRGPLSSSSLLTSMTVDYRQDRRLFGQDDIIPLRYLSLQTFATNTSITRIIEDCLELGTRNGQASGPSGRVLFPSPMSYTI